MRRIVSLHSQSIYVIPASKLTGVGGGTLTSGIAYTKLPRAAPPWLPASMFALVTKSKMLVARMVRCRWMRVLGLWGRLRESSMGLLAVS